MAADRGPKISRSQKLTFAVVACTLLCLLFPVAAPLFFSLFVGVAVRESGIDAFTKLLGEVFPLRGNLLPRPDAGRSLRGQHPARADGPEAAAAGHAGPDDLGPRRPARRLHSVFLEWRQVQPDHRHCRGQLRTDHGQDRPEGCQRRPTRGDRHAAGAGSQHQWRNHSAIIAATFISLLR
jgi:hypothetical protein